MALTYLDKLNWGSMQDNPMGEFRPNEALIEAVASRAMPSGRALDLSDDKGIDALYLAQSGYAVALVAFFPDELTVARERIEATGARVQTFSAEPTRMPFHPGEFDIVFDPRTYEMLRDGERTLFLAEMFRVLRPGGVMVVVVPDYKDSEKGCLTRDMAAAAFQPPFEVMRVVETDSLQGRTGRDLYAIMMRRP
jgi:SAM-dependent methyltransferase